MSIVEATMLPEWVQFMDICPKCAIGDEELFIAGWECADGLLGCFVACGHVRIAPFTRTTSQVRRAA